MRDMTQVAIDTLLASGTDRGVALAAEIERGRDRREQPRRAPTREQLEAESAKHQLQQERMLTQLRPAQPGEWAAWVAAYLTCTRNPQIRRYRHTTEHGRVYVATCDLEVLPLYGARALQVILPKGIRDFGGDTGHTDLYGYGEDGKVTYRGFHDTRWPHFVPVYADTELPEAGTVILP